MRPFRWPWPLILPAPYCCPIWKVKRLQDLSLALLSDGEGSLIDARKGIGLRSVRIFPLEDITSLAVWRLFV